MSLLVRTIAFMCFIAACGQSPSSKRACQQDTDCSAPTICQTCNSTCVFAPKASCDLSAPCPCGWSCRAGTCQSDLGVLNPACTFNRDCPVDMFCNRAKYECQFPMTLSESTGTPCATNADCTGAGEVCSTANGAGQCALDETHQCFDDAECPTGDQCNQQGQCQHHSC